ncbi:MAG: AbrB/MazE/SpoVT family DNA-binding domain-containing protein [Candidatus Woesearchaeota archaeon]
MANKNCPQCKANLEKVKFDVGYGIEVESLHCKKCGFNITQENKLENAIKTLREQMNKEVKVVTVGTGLGIRFPNEFVKNYKLKKGEDITIKPESDGIKIVPEI